jgi:hypothetical protein
MVDMVTVLTEFADNGDSRTYSLPSHTALKPKLLTQKRKVATNNSANASLSVRVVMGTQDAEGIPLSNRVSLGLEASYPVAGSTTDVDAAIAVFRDYVASDEFVSSIKTQNWLKGA